MPPERWLGAGGEPPEGEQAGRRAYDQGGVVEFGVKELLQSIRDAQVTGFSTLETKLDAKADKSDVSRLFGHHEALERRVSDLEAARAAAAAVAAAAFQEARGRTEWWRWVVPTSISTGAVLTVVLQAAHVF